MKRKKIPIWLRRLDVVKKEFQAMHWPSQQEGLEQGLALMAMGLQTLERQKRIADLKIFSKRDSLWANQWRKERGRIFPRSTRP